MSGRGSVVAPSKFCTAGDRRSFKCRGTAEIGTLTLSDGAVVVQHRLAAPSACS